MCVYNVAILLTLSHISGFPWPDVSIHVVSPSPFAFLKTELTNAGCKSGSPPEKVIPPLLGLKKLLYLFNTLITPSSLTATSGHWNGSTIHCVSGFEQYLQRLLQP